MRALHGPRPQGRRLSANFSYDILVKFRLILSVGVSVVPVVVVVVPEVVLPPPPATLSSCSSVNSPGLVCLLSEVIAVFSSDGLFTAVSFTRFWLRYGLLPIVVLAEFKQAPFLIPTGVPTIPRLTAASF
jgi:hypothetical protein